MKPTPNPIIPLYQGTVEDLNRLSRQELQELAQKHGVPASFKVLIHSSALSIYLFIYFLFSFAHTQTTTIIERLMKQVAPKTESSSSSYVVDFIPLAPLSMFF